MKKFLPGLRIFKTVIAVLLCLVFFYSFGYYKPIYAAVACVLMMKTTSYETRKAGYDRMKGTLLGGFISYVTLVVSNGLGIEKTSMLGPFIMSFALLLSFVICKGFNQAPYVASMSGVVLLITLISHADDTGNIFNYVSIRMVETMIGISIAFIVNRYMDFEFLKFD